MGHIVHDAFVLASSEAVLSDSAFVWLDSVRTTDLGLALVGFRALSDGVCTATLEGVGQSDAGRRDTWRLEVRDGMVIEGGINFGGWEALRVSLIPLLAPLICATRNAAPEPARHRRKRSVDSGLHIHGYAVPHFR